MGVLESLIAILIIALLGMLSRKIGIFSKENIKVISSFIYYFALPSLFFVSISNTDLFSIDYQVVIGSLAPIMILLFILYLLMFFRIIDKDKYILLSLSICFGSNAFFGIAFFETLYDGKWLSIAIVMASVLGLIGIILSLVFLEYQNKKNSALGFLFKIISNPLIISIFLGLLFSVFEIKLVMLNNALLMIGKTAGGLAIFSLGIFIYDNFSMKAIRKALIYSVFRILALPLFTYLVIILFIDIDNELKQFLLIQSGIPAAVSLAIFAQRYEYRLAEVTGIVIISSIFSFVGLILLHFMSTVVF